MILAVETTKPRDAREPLDSAEPSAPEEKSPERISREELYEDIKDAARCSRVYLAMAVLSTIVATVGLYYNSVAIIIGAMVIAPLLGPNMASALATTLGDLALLRHALLTALAGIAATMVLSVIIGVLLQVNPASPEVASRTGVALGDIAVATNPSVKKWSSFWRRRIEPEAFWNLRPSRWRPARARSECRTRLPMLWWST